MVKRSGKYAWLNGSHVGVLTAMAAKLEPLSRARRGIPATQSGTLS